jgi:hypothetical protein
MSMLPAHFRRIGEIMGALSEAERKSLVRLLDKIVDHAAALGSPSAPAAHSFSASP